MDGDSGDEGNDELTCVRSDKISLDNQQAGEVPWKLMLETGSCAMERVVVDLQRGSGRWAREGYDI